MIREILKSQLLMRNWKLYLQPYSRSGETEWNRYIIIGILRFICVSCETRSLIQERCAKKGLELHGL